MSNPLLCFVLPLGGGIILYVGMYNLLLGGQMIADRYWVTREHGLRAAGDEAMAKGALRILAVTVMLPLVGVLIFGTWFVPVLIAFAILAAIWLAGAEALGELLYQGDRPFPRGKRKKRKRKHGATRTLDDDAAWPFPEQRVQHWF